jgi:hypothetical protein
LGFQNNRHTKIWPHKKKLQGLFGFFIISHIEMSMLCFFSKPEGTCFAFASNVCTLKNTMTFYFWDKSQMPKKKNHLYKCEY